MKAYGADWSLMKVDIESDRVGANLISWRVFLHHVGLQGSIYTDNFTGQDAWIVANVVAETYRGWIDELAKAGKG